jgi:hypothetical protein
VNRDLVRRRRARRGVPLPAQVRPGHGHQRIRLLSGPALLGELGLGHGRPIARAIERLVDHVGRLQGQFHRDRRDTADRVAPQTEPPARVGAYRVVRGRGRAAAQLPAALLDPRRGRVQCELEQFVLVFRRRDARQCSHFGIGECALGESHGGSRQRLEGMRHADLLASRAQRQIAAPMQPLGAVLEAPAQPPAALVEAADQHQEVVARRIDAGGEIDDLAVELVDGGTAKRTGIREGVGRHRGTSLWAGQGL